MKNNLTDRIIEGITKNDAFLSVTDKTGEPFTGASDAALLTDLISNHKTVSVSYNDRIHPDLCKLHTILENIDGIEKWLREKNTATMDLFSKPYKGPIGHGFYWNTHKNALSCYETDCHKVTLEVNPLIPVYGFWIIASEPDITVHEKEALQADIAGTLQNTDAFAKLPVGWQAYWLYCALQKESDTEGWRVWAEGDTFYVTLLRDGIFRHLEIAKDGCRKGFRIWSSMDSWFLTSAQFATGRPFHFLYSSLTRRYRAFITASSPGNEPFFVTFRKLEFTASILFVVYRTLRTALP